MLLNAVVWLELRVFFSIELRGENIWLCAGLGFLKNFINQWIS